jgi:large subunit ribosomal protein L6
MLSINIPKKIKITLTENWIIIEGPLGIKKKKKSKSIELFFDANTNKLWLLNENLKEKHFYLAILNKLILGVLKGFYFKLNIVGVGYKAFVEGKSLSLKLGFSHNILYIIPQDITVKILNQKLLTLLISGNDFQQVSQVAAQIRSLKPAEPYKGKGIKYFNEIIKKKEGKKTNV